MTGSITFDYEQQEVPKPVEKLTPEKVDEIERVFKAHGVMILRHMPEVIRVLRIGLKYDVS